MTIKEIKGAMVDQTIALDLEGDKAYFRVSFVAANTNGTFRLLTPDCKGIITLTRGEIEDLALLGSTYCRNCYVQLVPRPIDWEARQWELYSRMMNQYEVTEDSVRTPKPSAIYQIADVAVTYYRARKEGKLQRKNPEMFDVLRNGENEDPKGST